MKIIFIAALVMLGSAQALAASHLSPGSFTYQGKIYAADGVTAVESSSVTFKIQIYSPDGSCLLFEETHSRDMTGTGGIFALLVGEGVGTGAAALTLAQVFDNSASKTGASGCGYSPFSSDSRRMKMGFVSSSESVAVATDQMIQSVPYAMHASYLQGLGKDGFLQVSSDVTQAKAEQLFQYAAELTALGQGTSSVYAKASQLPISGGVLNMSGAGVIVNDTPASSTYAVNKNYTDSRIGGLTLDLTSLSGGQTLIWNSSQNKWTASTPTSGTLTSITAGAGLSGGTITTSGTISLPATGTSGTYSKVTTDAYGRVTSGANLSASDIAGYLGYTAMNKGGDTMAGAIDMGSHNITNVGYLSMSPSRYLGLGTFDASAEANLITNVLIGGGSSYAGATWYNSASKTVKFWDGSQAVSVSATQGTVTSITAGTGLSGGTISNNGTIAIAVTGVSAGSYGSATSVPVLAVNAQGQITSASSLTISGVTPGGSASGDLSGTYPAPTVNKIQGVSVSSSAPVSAQVLSYNGSAWAPKSLGLTDLKSSVTVGNLFSSPACTAAQSLTWSSVTDQFSCAAIGGLDAGAISSGTLSASRMPAFTGDATASAGSTSMTLAASGVTAGTYKSVTVDSKGRVTAGTNPTTLAGYGITDGGTVTSIAAGTGLTGGTISTSGTLAVNVGTGANQIVQLDANSKLPAVDGSALTGIAMPAFSNVVVYSTSGNHSWTVPSGVKKVFVHVWGAGGGGGGGTILGLSGSGGGAGGYGSQFVTVTPGDSISITVGAAGVAGGAGNDGTAGGLSKFGALEAGGGSKGKTNSAQPVSGGSSTMTINVEGGSGQAAGTVGGMGGGSGGGGGAGGGGSSTASVAGSAGATPGGGGGGGGASTLAGSSGGVGGAGRVIIWY